MLHRSKRNAPEEASILLTAYFGAPPDAATLRAFDDAMRQPREAMWAMVSEIFLAAPGADYDAHAAEYLSAGSTPRLDRYQTTYGKIAP
ncbi:MAG: hypothetical protein R3D84_18085 [Paracoccaceae bacterium]